MALELELFLKPGEVELLTRTVACDKSPASGFGIRNAEIAYLYPGRDVRRFADRSSKKS